MKFLKIPMYKAVVIFILMTAVAFAYSDGKNHQVSLKEANNAE